MYALVAYKPKLRINLYGNELLRQFRFISSVAYQKIRNATQDLTVEFWHIFFGFEDFFAEQLGP
jgi:hypothetical protein